MVDKALSDFICEKTHATRVARCDLIQSLWGGYGQLFRCHLDGAAHSTVIVKKVHWPHGSKRESNLSHKRKVRSYQVEINWYKKWAPSCDSACRVPLCFGEHSHSDGIWLVLEDLDSAGFAHRRHSVSDAEARVCLSWLAHFHARFLGEKPEGLWKLGTYWYLDTRPDELKLMNDAALRAGAPAIDRALRKSTWQTLVHGDAKLANFCFSKDGREVAAVDFQYVGGGVGVKDVAYLIGSCYTEEASERLETALLAHYFGELRRALLLYKPTVDFLALETDWRALYPVAWVDFHRFLKGWSPQHWDPQSYSERLSRLVLAGL